MKVQILKIRKNQSRSQHYERAKLEKRESFHDNYESNDKSFKSFSETFKAQRLS